MTACYLGDILECSFENFPGKQRSNRGYQVAFECGHRIDGQVLDDGTCDRVVKQAVKHLRKDAMSENSCEGN